MKYKICNRCKRERPLGEFRIMPSGKRHKFCTQCDAEYKDFLKKERESNGS